VEVKGQVQSSNRSNLAPTLSDLEVPFNQPTNQQGRTNFSKKSTRHNSLEPGHCLVQLIAFLALPLFLSFILGGLLEIEILHTKSIHEPLFDALKNLLTPCL